MMLRHACRTSCNIDGAATVEMFRLNDLEEKPMVNIRDCPPLFGTLLKIFRRYWQGSSKSKDFPMKLRLDLSVAAKDTGVLLRNQVYFIPFSEQTGMQL
jgi:hypothetical protein